MRKCLPIAAVLGTIPLLGAMPHDFRMIGLTRQAPSIHMGLFNEAFFLRNVVNGVFVDVKRCRNH